MLEILSLIVALALIPGAYGGTIVEGGGTSASCGSGSSASGTFEASNTGFASLALSNGPVNIDETRFVDDGTHHVDIHLDVDNGLVNWYSTFYYPRMGNIRPTNRVGIIDILDIANADQIIAQTSARIGPEADPSKRSSVEIQVNKVGSLGATFKGTTEATAGKDTQATLKGHVEGALTSYGTAYDGTNTDSEQGDSSGGPIKADLNLKSITGSTSVSGAGNFYVDARWGGKIQDAVNAAWNGDTIKVGSGTYTENVEIDKSLAINGAGASKTVVDGAQTGPVFGIGWNNPNVKVTLSGMTIRNGRAPQGGGIYSRGTLTLKDLTITDNNADQDGGGVFSSFSTVNMNGRSTITGNTANRNGGGIWSSGTVNMNGLSSIIGNKANGFNGLGGGIFNNGGTVNMYDRSTITDNTANGDEGGGGGIYSNGGTVNMNGLSSIIGNTAREAGGIFSEYTTVNMKGLSSITDNTAYRVGGIYSYGGTVNMYDRSTITDNTAERIGGGIYINYGTMNMNGRSTITGNTAKWGGGIYSWASTVNMYDRSTITDNTANEDGGGIFNDGGGIGNTGTVNMYDLSTITDNIANVDGGGIYSSGGGMVNMHAGSSITRNKANTGGGIKNSAGTLNLYDWSGNILPGYDPNNNDYLHFFGPRTKYPDNTPDDVSS